MKKSKFALAMAILLMSCFSSISCTKDQDIHPKVDQQEVPYDMIYGTTEDMSEPKKKRKKR